MPRQIVLIVTALLIAACGSSLGSENVTGGASTTVAADGDAGSTDSGGSEGDGTSPDGQSAPVEIVGPSLTPTEEVGLIDDPGVDPVLGSTAPAFTGSDFDGGSVTIGPDGRPKVVYFLAHWCGHCQDEVRTITDLVAGGSLPEGLDVYAVTIAVRDDQPNYPPSAWLSDFPGAVMRDSVDNQAASAAAVSGIPYALYLDGEHRIRARSVGSLDADAIAEQWDRLVTG